MNCDIAGSNIFSVYEFYASILSHPWFSILSYTVWYCWRCNIPKIFKELKHEPTITHSQTWNHIAAIRYHLSPFSFFTFIFSVKIGINHTEIESITFFLISFEIFRKYSYCKLNRICVHFGLTRNKILELTLSPTAKKCVT